MKKEKKKEKKERIIVLDKGLDLDNKVKQVNICCAAAVFPFRG